MFRDRNVIVSEFSIVQNHVEISGYCGNHAAGCCEKQIGEENCIPLRKRHLIHEKDAVCTQKYSKNLKYGILAGSSMGSQRDALRSKRGGVSGVAL